MSENQFLGGLVVIVLIVLGFLLGFYKVEHCRAGGHAALACATRLGDP